MLFGFAKVCFGKLDCIRTGMFAGVRGAGGDGFDCGGDGMRRRVWSLGRGVLAEALKEVKVGCGDCAFADGGWAEDFGG